MSERNCFVKVGGTTKKVVGVTSLDDLREKAAKAFGEKLGNFTYQEQLTEGEGTVTVDVDLESNEDFLGLKATQLIRASRVAPPAPASKRAAGITEGENTNNKVIANPQKISLSRFEYSHGASYHNWFFEGYSNIGVHHTMLSDHLRSLTYLKAMQENVHLIKDKVVMDIGCGSGIWALTAARLGAKRVYGVEAGGMAAVARENAKANGFENTVTIMHGKVEDFIAADAKDPDTGEEIQVDLIISEWMGYWLLTEGVLSSVFRARDAWLKKDTGMMFPSHCCMYITPFTDSIHKHFWDDVYGVKMGPVAQHIGERDPDREHVSVEDIPASAMLSEPTVCHWVDCLRDDLPHIETFQDTFSCKVSRSGPWDGFLGFFSIWFDPESSRAFPTKRKDEIMNSDLVALHTIPTESKNYDTHWHQSVLQLPPSELEEGDVVEGTLDWKPNQHESRYFDATIEWVKISKSGTRSAPTKRTWYKC
eukprot:NODE_1087_length_1585_cov_73.240234_g894_i0.p1 GENE.NODE_1087_length_1585_cov_73.240234_g894_i0~~NODE_1087_length_1585_cov_73.240234_g894_i0.p1  ORF type:complete len:478 (+),score=144.19 NODE_1087_length_1585_cov_73.240234_g894_i0:105-1538(+)